MKRINWLTVGAIFAGLSVAMGAFGAHALKGILDDYSESIYSKAVLYQMFHAAGILVSALYLRAEPSSRAGTAAALFSAGILLFSGSLYVLAISHVRWLGMITPLGGLCFISGWLFLAFAGTGKNRKTNQ